MEFALFNPLPPDLTVLLAQYGSVSLVSGATPKYPGDAVWSPPGHPELAFETPGMAVMAAAGRVSVTAGTISAPTAVGFAPINATLQALLARYGRLREFPHARGFWAAPGEVLSKDGQPPIDSTSVTIVARALSAGRVIPSCELRDFGVVEVVQTPADGSYPPPMRDADIGVARP